MQQENGSPKAEDHLVIGTSAFFARSRWLS
jgi:hypothetical protein